MTNDESVDNLKQSRRRWIVASAAALVAAAGSAGYAWRARQVAASKTKTGSTPAEMGAYNNVELQLTEQRTAMCSDTNASGVGLRGEYFAQPGFAGAPLLTRVDGPVDLDNTLDWPADKAGQRPQSVRWSGWIKAPVAGRYRFHAPAGVALSISKTVLSGPGAAPDAAMEMNAGRYYPITFEVANLQSVPADARLRLEWTAPYGSRFVVPRTLLYLPTDAAKS